jgi:hypothetical protein
MYSLDDIFAEDICPFTMHQVIDGDHQLIQFYLFSDFVFGFREIYVSFGGLQMMLKGDPSHCAGFELEQRLFLLMRKLT